MDCAKSSKILKILSASRDGFNLLIKLGRSDNATITVISFYGDNVIVAAQVLTLAVVFRHGRVGGLRS